jgi:hypothetical protein
LNINLNINNEKHDCKLCMVIMYGKLMYGGALVGGGRVKEGD